jgi:hypothetical protein
LFLGKISKIEKSLENLTKMRREKTKINKIGNEKQEITKNSNKIKGISRDYFENIYSNKVENIEEMIKF